MLFDLLCFFNSLNKSPQVTWYTAPVAVRGGGKFIPCLLSVPHHRLEVWV